MRHYSGWNRRVEYISITEQIAMREARKVIKNPFSIGDMVKTVDTYGNMLKTGFVLSFTQAQYGAWAISIQLEDDRVIVAYYPRGVAFYGLQEWQVRIRNITRKAHMNNLEHFPVEATGIAESEAA